MTILSWIISGSTFGLLIYGYVWLWLWDRRTRTKPHD